MYHITNKVHDKFLTHANGRSCIPAVYPHEHAILLVYMSNTLARGGHHVEYFRKKCTNEHTSFGTTLDSTGKNLINQPEAGILLIFAERRSLDLNTATSAMFDQRPARHHSQSCHSHHVSNVKIFESCH